MRIEIIKWVDTFGCPPGWEFEDELEYKVTEVTSVGFIRKETDTVVVLVPPHKRRRSETNSGAYMHTPQTDTKQTNYFFF